MNETKKSDVIDFKEESKIDERNEYSSFDYFKEHTTLLIAIISAVVAIMSFALDYAVALQNISYMEYWNISLAYIPKENGIQLYQVLSACAFNFAVILMHALMCQTATVYRYYYEIIFRQKLIAKEIKKRIKKQKREQKKINKRLQKKDACEEKEEIRNILISEDPKIKEASIDILKGSKSATKSIIVHAIPSLLISFLLSYFAVIIFNATFSAELKTGPLLLVSGILLLFDIAIYFVPIFFKKRPKTVSHEEMIKMANECIEKKSPVFRLEALVHKGWKLLASDKNIVMLIAQSVGAFIIGLIMFFHIGNTDMKNEKTFSIYDDDTGTYAIVYNNGDSLVLKVAEIDEEENTIEIDVRRQRVISATEVYYELYTFEEVVVTGKEESHMIERST